MPCESSLVIESDSFVRRRKIGEVCSTSLVPNCSAASVILAAKGSLQSFEADTPQRRAAEFDDVIGKDREPALQSLLRPLLQITLTLIKSHCRHCRSQQPLVKPAR